jgi:POT family proton-dependent oligopeptide transporter
MDAAAIRSPTAIPATTADASRWPPQIKYIVGNEAAERFSYYGMKSILALYITKALFQTDDRATTIIHLFGFTNYFMPLFGAWLSDRIWGRYKTILWISLFYCAGHGVLATSDLFHSVNSKLLCLYAGLGLIAFGSGGIKPCVSAFMGDQFRPDQAHLMRKAYGAFYFSINFGSFFSFIIIPWIAHPAAPEGTVGASGLLWQLKHAGFTGYSWAFAVPGILMAVATLIFWLGTRYYVMKPPARTTRTAGFFSVFLEAFRNSGNAPASVRSAAIVSLLTSIVLPVVVMVALVYVALQTHMSQLDKTIGWIGAGAVGVWYLLVLGASLLDRAELPPAFWNSARPRFNETEIFAARSVAPILAVFAFIPAFWALFEQSNSTWVLQGAQMIPFTIFGAQVGAEQMQSLNPLLVMILVPVLTWWFYPFLEKFGFKVTPLRRISLGLLLTSASYLLVGWFQQRIEAHEHITLAWQTISYIVLTTAEVLVSTTGLEFAYTQAAPSMKSMIMSFWLLTVAIGNLLVTTITQLGTTAGQAGGHGNESVTAGRFYLYAGLTFGIAVLFTLVALRYRYRDSGASTTPAVPAPA